MSTKARDSAKDFDTLRAAGNRNPDGLWSDGTTMWAADQDSDKIYAYSMGTKARDSAKDFDTLRAAGNTGPGGLWSDGTTMWVADWRDDKIYAYSMSTKARDSAKDFDTLRAAGNTGPGGLWSDGTTMWVVDWEDSKIYAYSMPRGTGAGTGTTTPGGSTGGGSARTVTHGSSVAGSISTPGERDRYSVALSAGQTLTAYTTGSTDTFGIFEDSGGTSLATNDDGGSGRNFRLSHTVSAEGTYYIIVRGYGSSTTGNYQLNVSISGGTTTPGARARDSAKDFNTLNYNTHGIWSDGTTIWVADSLLGKIYAYSMSTKARDSAKDFDTLIAAGNRKPIAIWSDGTTMWVSNWESTKIYAYSMAGM